MSIQFITQVVQVTSAILLIIAILLQRGEANVGSAFGGGDISETGNAKRRGSEKIVFIATFVIAILFVASVIFPLVTI
ncbi:MAG: preprotein translocase subunit SecG [Candidatus Kaiserbacteria bacterium]|nr:preprotein translocase subunit SecG [Candidatus Kaiserbacteria bacterium]